MAKEKNEIAVRETSYEVGKIKDMTAMSVILKSHVVKQGLYTNIKGKNYVHIEGWQFAGGLMGLIPKVVSVENLSVVGNGVDKISKDEIKWKADVEIIEAKTGKVMGAGFAICSSKESKKKDFDEYAILSMAQTRAVGKAYRNLIGWVMKLAGMESTPSEEMVGVGSDVPKGNELKTPSGIKSEITGLLKKLGVKGTADIKAEIKKLTGMEATNKVEDMVEIRNRLQATLDERQ